MDRVSSLIAATLAKRGLGQHALAALALHRVNGWLTEAFPNGNNPSRAEEVSDGVLHIACFHAVILQELQLRLPELRQFLQKECPFARIKDIRLYRSDGRPENALAPENPGA